MGRRERVRELGIYTLIIILILRHYNGERRRRVRRGNEVDVELRWSTEREQKEERRNEKSFCWRMNEI